MKVYAVTGTPCAGKSTYAKKLAISKGYLYFDLTKFVKDYGIYEHYDRSYKTYVVDVNEFVKVLNDVIQGFEKEGWKGVVLDGHMSHHLSSNKIEKVFVVRCDVGILRKRLKKRGYNNKKIEENVEAEIMETCLIESKEKGHKIKIIDGTKPFKRSFW